MMVNIRTMDSFRSETLCFKHKFKRNLTNLGLLLHNKSLTTEYSLLMGVFFTSSLLKKIIFVADTKTNQVQRGVRSSLLGNRVVYSQEKKW